MLYFIRLKSREKLPADNRIEMHFQQEAAEGMMKLYGIF